MRHTQLSNKTSTLTKFKKKIDKILQQINSLNQDDKKKAFNYVHNHFKGHSSFITPCETSKIVTETLRAKRKSKIEVRSDQDKITKKERTKSNFACPLCTEIKHTKMNLLKHLEIFHIGTPLSCLKCHRTFSSELSYDWHKSHLCGRKKRLLSKRFRCPECSKEFALHRHLILHQAGHKNNNCGYCNIVLTRRDQLIQHLLVKHNIKLQTSNFKCDFCKKVFIKRRSLYHHLKKHSQFACVECGKISSSLVEYNGHEKEHEKEKPWQCPHCKDRFSRRQLYFTHIYRHEMYKCLTCKESYASKARLYQHKQKGHAVVGLEPKFHCPYCDMAFHRSMLLQKHLLRHKEREGVLSCKYCNQIFATSDLYHKHCLQNNHNQATTEADIYICEYCGQQYRKKYLLDQHLLKLHGKEKGPYSCEHCDYSTKFKPNIKRHLSLHLTKEKQFVCDHCGKFFSNIAVLTDHISYIHKQVKQFKCNKCEKTFKRNTELNRHQSTHSDLRPYNCVLCSNTYKRISHLRRHEINTHGVVNKTNRVKRIETVEKSSSQFDTQLLTEGCGLTSAGENMSLTFLDFDVSDLISQNELQESSFVYNNGNLSSIKENNVQIIEYVNHLVPSNISDVGPKSIVFNIEQASNQ